MLGDVLLLTKIRNGDIAAFKEVFEKYYAPLCMYALYIVNDWTDAEEVVQELFYVIWKNRSSLPFCIRCAIICMGQCAISRYNMWNTKHRQQISCFRTEKQHDEEGSSDPQQQMEMSELENLVDKTFGKIARQM